MFGVTPEDVARAQWQRSTCDHCSLDPPSAVGGAGLSLRGVAGVAARGRSRSAADTRRQRRVAQVFRDAAEEASIAALDGTPSSGVVRPLPRRSRRPRCLLPFRRARAKQ